MRGEYGLDERLYGFIYVVWMVVEIGDSEIGDAVNASQMSARPH